MIHLKRYKRKESLRFEFAQPLDTSFYISRLKGKELKSPNGKGVILNVSPSGLKLETNLELPEEIELSLIFDIANHSFHPTGLISWRKKEWNGYHYGIDFLEGHDQPDLIEAIKEYQRQNRA